MGRLAKFEQIYTRFTIYIICIFTNARLHLPTASCLSSHIEYFRTLAKHARIKMCNEMWQPGTSQDTVWHDYVTA